MTFLNPAASATHEAILDFCKSTIDIDLQRCIQQLTREDLCAVNEHGETLFFIAALINEPSLGHRSSHVMQLLAHQAMALDETMELLLFLLFTGNAHDMQLIEIILSRNTSDYFPRQTEDVGNTFFTLLNHALQKNPNTPQPTPFFKMTGDMLRHAFLCKQSTMRDQFLALCHRALLNGSLSVQNLRELYFQANVNGFRLFDILILNASPENLVAFYQELRFLRQHSCITSDQHENILSSHAMGLSGYSPLHEVIATHCADKILDHINEITLILKPEKLNEALTKTNKHGYTAIQQAINNGKEVASFEVSKRFINLITPDTNVFTLDECIKITSGRSKYRLRCMDEKENAALIQEEIKKKQKEILALRDKTDRHDTGFSYASAVPTFTYFRPTLGKATNKPFIEPPILPMPSFEIFNPLSPS